MLQRLRKLWHRLRRGALQAREFVSLPRAALANQVRLSGAPGRLGLIGCGNQGRAIAQSVQLLPGWSVCALYDNRHSAAAALRDACFSQAACCQSEEDFWRQLAQIDVVAIATNTPSHHALAMAAIAHGARAVLLEKPVAHSLQAAQNLEVAAASANCRIAVNHTRRYLDSTAGIKRLLQQNVAGAPRSIHFLAGQGGVANLGTHYFDFARDLFDGEIIRVRAELEEPPASSNSKATPDGDDRTGRCEALLENEVRISIDLSRDVALRQLLVVILCEHGRIEIDENLGFVRLVGSGGRLWQTPLAFREALATARARALHELHASSAPRCSLADGRAALEAVMAAFASHRQGGAWIELPIAAEARAETFQFA